jgi:Uma2 family endonuclease
MTTPQRLPLVSVEDYLAAEEQSDIRHEYTGGYVHAMAGGKTSHNRVKGNVFAALHKRLDGKQCEPFDSDMKVRLLTAGLPRFYYPDAMVVCEPNGPDSVYQDRPVIVVEVLSVSTRRQDCEEKRDAYLTIPSLRAYLLVEPDEAKVSVYRRKDTGAGLEAFDAQLYTGRDAVIPLDEIEVELPLAEVYERVEFEA